MRKSVEQRLLDKSSKVDGCLLWMGPVTSTGYGKIKVDGRTVGVHRVAYAVWNGPIPEGLEIDHLCRVRNCINPEHLEAVTRRENIRRGEGPIAKQIAQVACLRGHLLPPPEAGRVRECRECRVERITCGDCGADVARKRISTHRRLICKKRSVA
jgi:hypothetical protein